MRASSWVADPGSLSGLRQAMLDGGTDPVQALQACFSRIDAAEHAVRGFCRLDRERALAQAEALRRQACGEPPRRPLHGVPVAIKDVIDVAGWPTVAGSRTRATSGPAMLDATVVAQLRAAGAVVVGKAHTTEFAYFDGPPPTRNPHDLARTPGGSSAGPAAVVAAGMVPLSLGTQTAGSVSRPAAYCGIAAFKPSTLSWPSSGVVPFAPSFDTVGLFAYRVADVGIAARALLQPFQHPGLGSAAAVEPARLGLVEDPLLDLGTPAVRASLHQAVEALKAGGARVETCRSPVAFADVVAWHTTVTEFELARAQGQLLAAPDGDVTAALRAAVARGRAIEDARYHQALRALAAARARFWAACAQFDALLFPAAPDVAPVGTRTGDPRFIIPFTALGGPIVSVPVGFDRGMPLGIMLLAAPGRDARLLDVAEQIAPAVETARAASAC